MRKGKLLRFIMVCIFCLGLNSMAFATGIDIMPPSGEMTIKNASLKDGIYYTTVSELILNITATDNVTSPSNLKMLISNSPITADEVVNDSLWQTYSGEGKCTIDGEVGKTSTVYLYLKDEAGNISPNVVTSSKTFTVTYSGDGAVDLPPVQTATYGVPFSIAVREPKKVNKYFMGWSLDPEATAESWLSDGTIEPKQITSNITLYAVWADEPRSFAEVAKVGDWATYPVEYENVNTNASSYKSNVSGWRVLDVTGGVVKLISAGTPLAYNKAAGNTESINALTTNFLQGTSTNYTSYGFEEDLATTFTNEYTESVESLATSNITKLTGTTTLLDLDVSKYGGILNNGSYYYIAGAADTENLYYVQADEEKISSATGVTYGIRPVVTLSDVTQIKGRNQAGEWKIDMPNIKVRFDTNGGESEVEYITYKYGNKYANLPDPTKDGYTFAGWYTSLTGGSLVTEDTKVTTQAEHTLHARWTAKQYTVTLDADGGTSVASIVVTYDSTYSNLPTPTKAGYDFAGWYTEDGTKIETSTKVTILEAQTLKARWTAKELTVTLNRNDGTTSTSIKVTYGGKYQGLPELTRTGYNFLGWFTLATGGTEVTEETDVTNTENHEIYAHWEQKPLMDLIRSIANAPVLNTDEGMRAVYWTDENGNGETEADAFTEAMYSYVRGDGKTDSKDSKWANAVTEDGSYWVWIPRYAYKITYATSSAKTTVSDTKTKYGNIDILFMYGTSDTQYRDENGNAVDLPDGYKVHPAFQAMEPGTETTSGEAELGNPLGKWDEELEGIWVAKYEASRETSTDGVTWTAASGTNSLTVAGTSRVVSKPSVVPWTNIRQTYIYTNSLNMYKNLNSHEMKNSEWGAVAYLTHSAYGRNGNEIGVNQAYNSSTYVAYTGAGPGGTADVSNSSTYSSDYASYAWNTTQGKKASSTGNIYGIYDLSGGAYEYVAAYVNNSLASYGANLVNATDMKTKQVYATSKTETVSETQQGNYNANSGVYGDAVYETSTSYSGSNSWNNDYSNFPYSSDPFFMRGGYCLSGSNAGVFSFLNNNGYSSYYGFRPVLCVSSGT